MTDREEIRTTIKEIFLRTLKIQPERLQPDTALGDDLKLDSLDMIEVVYEVEDHFDVQIPEDRVRTIRTFGEIVDGLHAALTAKG